MDLSGEETQKAFDVVLSNLARSAPPLPGFRRQKGGKNVVNEVLYFYFLINIWLSSFIIEIQNSWIKDFHSLPKFKTFIVLRKAYYFTILQPFFALYIHWLTKFGEMKWISEPVEPFTNHTI